MYMLNILNKLMLILEYTVDQTEPNKYRATKSIKMKRQLKLQYFIPALSTVYLSEIFPNTFCSSHDKSL